MSSARRHLEPQTSTNAVQARETLGNANTRLVSGSSTQSIKPSSLDAVHQSRPSEAKKPMTVYDEAVQRVQEWNEALNGRSILSDLVLCLTTHSLTESSGHNTKGPTSSTPQSVDANLNSHSSKDGIIQASKSAHFQFTFSA